MKIIQGFGILIFYLNIYIITCIWQKSEYYDYLCQSLYTYYNLFLIFFLFQVIDFGSSCYEHQRVYTYIQSRFYRAPEVILGARYGMPIDMWSLGCILAELLTGYPLLPGEDEGDQLSCIIELLGMPPQKLLDQSKRAKNFISSKGKQMIIYLQGLTQIWLKFTGRKITTLWEFC